MKTAWDIFWNKLTDKDKELFRLLQSIHRNIDKNRSMFCYSYLSDKQAIHNYVITYFKVDLDNLPSSK